jgi:4'-phosphopantetheinyl transferase
MQGEGQRGGARPDAGEGAGALPGGTVRVWLAVPEAASGAALAAAEALLDASERARAARLRSEAARRSFVVSHGLARRSLSRCASVPPAAWRFAARAGGRPEVEGPPAGLGLRFNLSHTEGLVACAVARDAQVGVDVECASRVARPLALAERFFAPEEAAALRALPEQARRERFLALWSLKEALLKARGVGVAQGLAAVRLAFEDGAPRLLASGEPGAPASAWQLALRWPTPRHALALAVRRDAGAPFAIEVACEDGAEG